MRSQQFVHEAVDPALGVVPPGVGDEEIVLVSVVRHEWPFAGRLAQFPS